MKNTKIKVSKDIKKLELKKDFDLKVKAFKDAKNYLTDCQQVVEAIKSRNDHLKIYFRVELDRKYSQLQAEIEKERWEFNKGVNERLQELKDKNKASMEAFKSYLQDWSVESHEETKAEHKYKEASNFDDLVANPFMKSLKKEIKAKEMEAFELLECCECQLRTPELDGNMLCEGCYIDIQMEEVEPQAAYLYNQEEYDTDDEVRDAISQEWAAEDYEPGEPSQWDIINKILEPESEE